MLGEEGQAMPAEIRIDPALGKARDAARAHALLEQGQRHATYHYPVTNYHERTRWVLQQGTCPTKSREQRERARREPKKRHTADEWLAQC